MIILAFQSTFPAKGTTKTEALKIYSQALFQSTFPAKGTTQKLPHSLKWCLFQSTFPAKGTTLDSANARIDVDDFNPRSPQRERRIPVHYKRDVVISIHVPRKGNDSNFYQFCLYVFMQQLHVFIFSHLSLYLNSLSLYLNYIFLCTFLGANLQHFLCATMVRTYKIRGWSTSIPWSTPMCSTLVR